MSKPDNTPALAKELDEILRTPEFQQDLKMISSYLASIKQERAIIYSLAKILWKRGRLFRLEVKETINRRTFARDLVVYGNTRDNTPSTIETHVEVKHHFDCDMPNLKRDLEKYRNKPRPLGAMWEHYQGTSKGWSEMAQIYYDMCVKRVHDRLADIFVWMISARDLSEENLNKLPPGALERICWSEQQCNYNVRKGYPYSDEANLDPAEQLLNMISRGDEQRQWQILKVPPIVTEGDFPSTYYLRICASTPNKSSPASAQIRPVILSST
jgi:hypothetical protein